MKRIVASLLCLSLPAHSSYQTFPGGMLWSHPLVLGSTPAVDASTYQIDASGERVQCSIKIPQTGTLDKFATIMAAVGNTPDNGLRFSFQDPDANGFGDGVVDQFATVASGSVATGFLDPGAFDSTRSVTRGAGLVLVIDMPTWVSPDNVIVQSWVSASGNTFNFPIGVSVTNTTSVTRLPQVFLHYTDNGGSWVSASPWIIPALSTTTSSIDTGTNPTEIGLKFQVPFACKLSEWQAYITMTVAGSDFDSILYDASSTALATISHDGDFKAGGTSLRLFDMPLQTEQTLSANTVYRLSFKPTTTNNIAVGYYVVPSQLVSLVPGGANWCMTQRNAGTWKDFNNGTDGYQYPAVWLGFSAFSDGIGGGERSATFVE